MTSLPLNRPRRDLITASELWVPQRRFTAAVLLIAGVATLVTSFAALPLAVLGGSIAAWTVLVIVFAQSARGPAGFPVLSICVKATTLALIAVILLVPDSPIGPKSVLYWIPLGLLNMGSGLWFLRMIRGRAR